METLVVVPQHRNRYFSREKFQGQGPFGWSPSKGFRDLSCRSFESGIGLLPIPLKPCSAPRSNNRSLSSPKTPTLLTNGSRILKCDGGGKNLRRTVGSSPIPINSKAVKNEKPLSGSFFFTEICVGPGYSNSLPATSLKGGKERTGGDNIPFSERWAGPTYSNSPPPSSLPMPRFSLQTKRTFSLELPPRTTSDLNFTPLAKSAPASPTRDMACSPSGFLNNDDSATKTLRRILHLDLCDD